MSEETQGIGHLAAALAKAQAEFGPIKKELEVKYGATIFRYADLAAVIEATQDALTKNGLTITQTPTFMDDKFVLITRLIHKDGASIMSYWPLPAGKPQEMGSALTYARRYSLSAILNVASEADDDGQQAEGTKPQKATPKAESAAVKAAAEQKEKEPRQKPTLIALDLGNGQVTDHGSVSAFLDAYEAAALESDDSGASLFNANEATLQELQARAAKAKQDTIVQRIAVIFKSVHDLANDIPNPLAGA